MNGVLYLHYKKESVFNHPSFNFKSTSEHPCLMSKVIIIISHYEALWYVTFTNPNICFIMNKPYPILFTMCFHIELLILLSTIFSCRSKLYLKIRLNNSLKFPNAYIMPRISFILFAKAFQALCGYLFILPTLPPVIPPWPVYCSSFPL